MSDIYVLKFGGNSIAKEEDLVRLSQEIAGLITGGSKVVLVHGGGPEINAEMEKRGKKPVKVAGVRVTDTETLEIVKYVLSNINSQIIKTMKSVGAGTKGFAGSELASFDRKKPYTVMEDGKEITVDLLNVGEVKGVDVKLIESLVNDNVMPVVYPIGKDENGNELNINADEMAAGIAAAIQCKEMIQITDVPGVLLDVNDPSSLQSSLSLAEVDELIASGVISGGMVAKVEACRKALLAGVPKVRMINGKDPNSILTQVVKNGVEHGTVITQ